MQKLLSYVDSSGKCFAKGDTLLASLYRTISLAFYDAGEFRNAVSYVRKSINVSESADLPRPADKFKVLAKDYYFLQVFFDSLGQRSEQLKAIDSCLSIEKNMDDDYKWSKYIIGEKVRWLYDIGDYGQCVSYADFGETIISRHYKDADSLNYILYIITYKIQALAFLGKETIATKLLEGRIASAARIRNRRGSVSALRLNFYLGIMYSLAAQDNLRNHQPKAALYNYQAALRANLDSENRKGCAENFGSIAILLINSFGQPDSAIWYCRQGLRYSDRVDSMVIFNTIADGLVYKGDFAAAGQNFRLAFDQLKPGMKPEHLLTLPINQQLGGHLIDYLNTLIIDYGNFWLKAGIVQNRPASLDSAIAVYLVADKFLTRIKSEHFENETKIFWRSVARKLYENAIEACYRRGDNEKAFYFFERSRAVLLNDKLKMDRMMPIGEIRQQDSLRHLRETIQRQIAAAGDESLLHLQKQLSDINQQLEILYKRNNRFNASDLSTDINLNPQFVRSRLLQTHEALIELFAGDSSVYVITVTRGNTIFRKIDKLSYDGLTARYLTHLTRPSALQSAYNDFIFVSSALYKLLFDETSIKPGRIIISPDGNYFPFEALIVKPGMPVHYLLNDYAVSYTYSAAFLLLWEKSPMKPVDPGYKSFLGMAPVRFPKFMNLGPLYGSDVSLRSISAGFEAEGEPVSASDFTGTAASRNNFLKHFADYKIIHLYTHAAADAGQSDPVLYFSDSVLALEELPTTTNSVTSLIVLAACESGLGRYFLGEGVFSFNRAFAAIGIPAAVVNLWSVDSKSTYKLNEFFYKHLQSGLAPDLALQKAKLEFLENSEAEQQIPYFWAPAVLTGLPDEISFQHQQSFFKNRLFIAASVLLFLLIAIMHATRSGGEQEPED